MCMHAHTHAHTPANTVKQKHQENHEHLLGVGGEGGPQMWSAVWKGCSQWAGGGIGFL